MKPGYKQTEVGVIPEDWGATLLDQIAKRGSGHTPDKKHTEYWNGDIKWISLADTLSLDRIYISKTFASITPEGIANSSAVVHPAGTVVLSRDAGIGKSAIMQCEMAVSQHFMAWRCGAHLNNHFLYYWLQSAKPQFERIANGSTILTIGLQYFRDLKVPHPPLPEQRAIAEALSDVDALLASLDRLIAKKRDLKTAAMQQLLTGKTRLPGFSGEWKVKTMNEVCWFQEGPGVRNTQFTASGIKLLNGTNIFRGVLSLDTTTRFISEKEGRGAYAHFLADAGDIVLASSGVTIERLHEKVAFVRAHDLPFCMNTSTIRFKPFAEVLAPSFLFQFLTGDDFKKRIGGVATGSAQLNFGPSHVAKVELTLPPLLEQKAIAEVLSDMDAELAALEKRRDKTRDLKQGMMQELLTGRTRLV